MVSTRRARSEGLNTASEGAAEKSGSQAEISSKQSHEHVATGSKNTQLQAIAEGVPLEAASPAGTAQEQEVMIPTQELEPQQRPQNPAQQHTQVQQVDRQQRSQRRQLHEQVQQDAASQLPPAPAAHPAIGTNPDSSDDSDWDFDGPDVLQNLAATIRSALGTGTGQGRLPHEHMSAAAAATPVGGNSRCNVSDPEELRWCPATGLQVAAQAGLLVQSAAATLPPKQQQELAAAGPLVQIPPAAAAPVEASSAASKPKVLAKRARAPSLDPTATAKEVRKSQPQTAGKQWFDLPAVKITDEVKRDLRLLRLRGAYDPKRFYRSFDETKFPKHFAVGTVVDDPLDYYGGRLSKGQRKASLTEQLLADSELSHSRRKRYNKLQEEANKWVKSKKQKTNKPRITPSRHRPKH